MNRSVVVSLLVLVSLLCVPMPGSAQSGSCTNDGAFSADVTVPDGSTFKPEESFVKIWRVKNTGSCNWAADFSLNWVGGDKMGPVTSQIFGKPVPAGQMAEIAVEMQAPARTGPAVSWWKIEDSAGKVFGDELYVKIEVAAPTPIPTLTVAPTPATAPTLAPTPPPTPRPLAGPTVKPTGRVVHFEFYVTDGYINSSAGAWPPDRDFTSIPGWRSPIYVWGLTDADPNAGNLMRVPPGAGAAEGSAVGNAGFPAPFIEVRSGDDVYVTLHNRGFRQENQSGPDDCALQFVGIPTSPQYSGFAPAGSAYEESLRHFWQEPWYLALGPDTATRDRQWNTMAEREQQALLAANTPLVKPNRLSPGGAVRSRLDDAPAPAEVANLPDRETAEDQTQFTYYFRAPAPGSYFYRCVAAQRVVPAFGSGAVVVRPGDFGPENKSAYGSGTGTEYDREYTLLLSEIDPAAQQAYERGNSAAAEGVFQPALWFMNGRSFPMTLTPFAWNSPGGSPKTETRYDTRIQGKPGERLLIRFLNTGSVHLVLEQGGVAMNVIGVQASPLIDRRRLWALPLGPGETADAITLAPGDQPLAPLAKGSPWRLIWTLREASQPATGADRTPSGGMMTVIEIGDVTSGLPTWLDPNLTQEEEASPTAAP